MDINKENNDELNAKLANDYLSQVQDPKGRANLRKEHSELEVAIQSYEYMFNSLSNFPISDRNKKNLLDNVAEHYADRIAEPDSKPLSLEDGRYARTIFERVRVNRNEESAQYFHDHIEDLVFSRNARMPESHSELNNAYDHYRRGININPEQRESMRDLITQQIKLHSPESILPIEQEQEHAR